MHWTHLPWNFSDDTWWENDINLTLTILYPEETVAWLLSNLHGSNQLCLFRCTQSSWSINCTSAANFGCSVSSHFEYFPIHAADSHEMSLLADRHLPPFAQVVLLGQNNPDQQDERSLSLPVQKTKKVRNHEENANLGRQMSKQSKHYSLEVLPWPQKKIVTAENEYPVIEYEYLVEWISR